VSNTVTIDRDYFEHLLNCLANQKFLHIPDSQMTDREKEMQQAIDDAHHKGRELLTNSLQEDMQEEWIR
jgi:hypothetical protein